MAQRGSRMGVRCAMARSEKRAKGAMAQQGLLHERGQQRQVASPRPPVYEPVESTAVPPRVETHDEVPGRVSHPPQCFDGRIRDGFRTAVSQRGRDQAGDLLVFRTVEASYHFERIGRNHRKIE